MVILATLIVFFAYFYTAIQFDPVKQADNLRKQGGFIPGIRPGAPTANYLNDILVRITLPGALFLAAIALVPTIVLVTWGLGAVPVRWHLGPDRRGRGPRDDETDRVAAADAALRGLPEVGASHAARVARAPGGGEGDAGSAPGGPVRHPADLHRRHPARARADRDGVGHQGAGVHGPRRIRLRPPGRADGDGPPRRTRRAEGVHPRRVPAHGAAGPGARGRPGGRGPAADGRVEVHDLRRHGGAAPVQTVDLPHVQAHLQHGVQAPGQ